MMSPFLSATQQFSYVTDHQKNTRDYLFPWPLEFYNRDKRRGGGRHRHRLSSKPPPSFESPRQRSMENFRKRKKQCPDEEGFLVAQLNPFVPAGEGPLVHRIKVVPIRQPLVEEPLDVVILVAIFLFQKATTINDWSEYMVEIVP